MTAMDTTDRSLPPLLLSIKDTAAALGISERTVWTLVNEGQLPHLRVGRRLLFSRAALEEWIAARHRAPNAASSL
jgi:excisionase family DNA binding protein